MVDRSLVPPKFAFTYHFRHNTDGWQPQIVYIDPETGRPLPDAILDQSFKVIPWYGTANFNALPF